MDVFKLKPSDDDCIRLKNETFHRLTGKQPPYYQVKNGKAQHYATCPACDNPIHIVNLDVDSKVDSLGRRLSLFAKHAKSDVAGIGKFDQDAYDDCPLANPEAFTGKRRRTQGKVASEIVMLLIEYADVVEMVIRKATGVQFSEEAFSRILKAFRAEEGYLYRHVSKFNLPYAVMYMAEYQSIVDTFVAKESNLRASIEKHSKLFYVNKIGRICRKTGSGQANIGIFLTKHVIPKDPELPQTLAMVVEERIGDTRAVVVEIEIEIDQSYFYNTVAKRKRMRALAADIFR